MTINASSPEAKRKTAAIFEKHAEHSSNPQRAYEIAKNLRIAAQAQECGFVDDQDGSMEWGPDA